VFSQWLGTHQVLMRRLAKRGWGHVFFHGGVPAAERGALVDRFHNDPGCRLFLSTDAGSTGLNLQHAAATVVNMDLPWNPAVLAQRIGRVHRMGQRHGVQVINLVAQGSIEESIQGLLVFKQSLADGVLDGGDSSVFMEGGRLTRFMKQVDAVTAGIGAADAVEPVPANAPAGPGSPLAEAALTAALPADHQDGLQQPPAEAPAPTAAQAAAADPWAPLLQAGMALLTQLAQPAATPGNATAASALSTWVHTDPASGRQQLRLPLPAPATVQALADGLAALAAALQQRPQA